jgi:uncharacterized protein (DUF58 family)
MQLTRRSLLLLLMVAPLVAAATWSSIFVWLAALWLGAVAILVAVDWAWAGPSSAFTVVRKHDKRLSLGADNRVELQIAHRLRRRSTIVVRDDPPAEFVSNAPLLAGQLIPGRRWHGEYVVHPRQRGNYQFGDVYLRWHGPMQLVQRQGHLKSGSGVKVYPNMLGVRRYDLLLRQNRLQELGLRHARLTGQGTEFERLREYRPDDEYRRINWKATARRLRPITIAYQTERSQNIVVVLDTGRLMQSPVGDMAKLDYAINATLLLTYVAAGIGDKVGLLTFAARVQDYVAPRQGRKQFYRLLDRLYAVESHPVEPDFGQGLRYLAYRQRRRALIVIFTDIAAGASMNVLIRHVRLLARNNLPLVVTISDPDLLQMAQRYPQDSSDVYERAMAGQLLRQRRMTLERLGRHGVQILDAPANQLTPDVVSRYLDLKRQGRI